MHRPTQKPQTARWSDSFQSWPLAGSEIRSPMVLNRSCCQAQGGELHQKLHRCAIFYTDSRKINGFIRIRTYPTGKDYRSFAS